MKVIVDTNIIFSTILNTNSKIGDILLNSTDIFSFYSVDYLQTEIENHKDKLIKISKLSPVEIDSIKTKVYSKISFISEEVIPTTYWHKAANYVSEVDMDDIAFVALSLFLENVLIWTGDKKLLNGITNAGFKHIVNTDKILEIRKQLDTDP